MAKDSGARRTDLDRAKGLGIFLVVLGHVVARDYPTGNEWYVLLKTGLYEFHMPFFMYLSGYVTFLSGAARTAPSLWIPFVAKRAQRLLLPFMIFGLSITFGKVLLAPYLHIDNPPTSVAHELRDLVWHTDLSVAVSIWYMAVLFILSCITPPLLRLLGGRTWMLLIATVLLYFTPVPHVLFLNRVAAFYVFFVLGGLAAEAGARWLQTLDRIAGWSVVALLTFVTTTLCFPDAFTPSITLLLCGAISMPALHGLIRKAPFSHSQVLLTLGFYSFAIYILNTPCIGLTKALMWKIATWDGTNFLVYAPILMVVGLLGPILIKKRWFRHLPALDRMTQ